MIILKRKAMCQIGMMFFVVALLDMMLSTVKGYELQLWFTILIVMAGYVGLIMDDYMYYNESKRESKDGA